MKVISSHYGMNILRGEFERAVADARTLGQSYVVIPWLDEVDRANIKGVCELINKGAEVCKKYGMRMGYHNHDFEFKEQDGSLIFDTMLAELDPKLVSMELDLYWVVRAGYDPIKYFEKYPGRFEQWHVKDMDKADSTKNTEVGNGSIDFKTIFTKAKLSGMKHFYVEQETFTMPSTESAKICIENLQKML
jgi:sugar phosphate isomerase/epimerase